MDVSKLRSAPVTWIWWIGSTAAILTLWCFRKIIGEKKPLTRAQEKQRRKALVRQQKI